MTAGYLVRAANALEGRDDSPASRRRQALGRSPRAIDLAVELDYATIVTPALERFDAELMRVQDERQGRAVLTCPPQEGKSTLLRYFCLRCLIANPDLRIGYVSYQAQIARASGLFVRSMIETHGDRLGLEISSERALGGDWKLQDHRGGMVSVGIGGALTGRPIDFLIIDDPLSGQKDADSVKILEAQEGWWRSVGRTRLAPAASVVITQTRWTEADLAGNRIAEGWPQVNIPAVSDGKTPDALEREPGVYLTSARERTEADWDATRADVGERVWAALYQGRPAPVAGGVYKTAWIERNRRQAKPELVKIITMVDPADNEGSGDEAAIITGGATADGKFAILADDSSHMTAGRWFRVAFLAALSHGSMEVCYERSLSGLQRRGREAWKDLRTDAMALFEAIYPTGADFSRFPAEVDEEVVYSAALSLASYDQVRDEDELEEIKQRLREMWWAVAKVLRLPQTGVPVRAVTPEGSKLTRAKLAAPLVETNKVQHIGAFPLLEHTLTTWQVGMPSPDRMDAYVHLLLELSQHSTATTVHAPKGKIKTTSTQRSGAGSTIQTRSSGRGWR